VLSVATIVSATDGISVRIWVSQDSRRDINLSWTSTRALCYAYMYPDEPDAISYSQIHLLHHLFLNKRWSLPATIFSLLNLLRNPLSRNPMASSSVLLSEIDITIVETHFGVRALRRHVVDRLQQMPLMHLSIDNLPVRYSGYAQDHQARTSAGRTTTSISIMRENDVTSSVSAAQPLVSAPYWQSATGYATHSWTTGLSRIYALT